MTNIIAVVLISVVTNWAPVGTLTLSKDGSQYKVEEARTFTNHTVSIKYEDQVQSFVLKSVPGDVVGERRTKIEPVLMNSWVMPNLIFTNHPIYLTNYYGSNVIYVN